MKEATLIIRDALSEDAQLLSHLIQTSFRDVAKRFNLTRENCPKHPSNYSTEWIDADLRRGVQYFILMYDGKPVGCVGIERANPGLCYLERLSVLPRCRRQGFGKVLVRHVLDQAMAMGVSKVGIGIIAEQTDLKQWYQKLGFVERQIKEFPHLPFLVCFMEYVIEST